MVTGDKLVRLTGLNVVHLRQTAAADLGQHLARGRLPCLANLGGGFGEETLGLLPVQDLPAQLLEVIMEAGEVGELALRALWQENRAELELLGYVS